MSMASKDTTKIVRLNEEVIEDFLMTVSVEHQAFVSGKIVLDEFFRITFRKNFYESIEALHDDLDTWLVHDNNERPHRGYRNKGKRPYDTVCEFASIVSHEH